jgi:tetratricopeptide (TPR) repeat protein
VLEDLTDRALVTSDPELRLFAMMPLVAVFLRHARPEAVRATADRLADRAYAVAVENGYQNYGRFPVLEAAWPTVAAALPLFLQASNDRLQTVCRAVKGFLNFSGRWDERLSLSLQAEARALAAADFSSVGWRAYDAGWVHFLRGQSHEVLACADRAATAWVTAKGSARDRAIAVHLRGLGHQLTKDYQDCVDAFGEVVELMRSLSPESLDVANALNALAEAESLMGDLVSAEADSREGLRIAKAVGFAEGIASATGTLAGLALERENWADAEALAREAVDRAEMLGHKELVASNCARLAKALVRQNRKAEALSHVQRAVELYTLLRSPQLDGVRGILEECRS